MQRILVVDDNRDYCDSVKDILEMEGYEAVSVYGGQKAVEMAEKQHFDLILMDLVMPGMDGVTTIKHIKKISPSVPIIAVTGFSEENVFNEALEAGVNGTLGKPLDFASLLSGIETGSIAIKNT